MITVRSTADVQRVLGAVDAEFPFPVSLVMHVDGTHFVTRFEKDFDHDVRLNLPEQPCATSTSS